MAQIVPFEELSSHGREAAARLLMEAFAAQTAGWHTIEAARGEVDRFFTDADRRAWACFEGEHLAGWIGRIINYRGKVWELHPLMVDPPFQRRGIGRLLVATLEAAARQAGISTITLGTDDEIGGTTAFGADLYPDIWRHARDIEETTGHPLGFYRKLGYTVYGLLPDANGWGRPDILMAKRISAKMTGT